jgi:hypothetical protein
VNSRNSLHDVALSTFVFLETKLYTARPALFGVYIILIVIPSDVYISTGLNAMSFLYNAIFHSVTVRMYCDTIVHVFKLPIALDQ